MTLVEQLADNRVRLTVDVSAHELEHAREHATNDLAESVKIPGFRKGKVPTAVLVSRIGKDRIWTEAIESHIGGWFWNAAARNRVRPVSPPDYSFDALPDGGESWTFTAEVDVQPMPEIVDWKELEVPRAEVEVPEELVGEELEAIRRSVAGVLPVDRPAEQGDTLVIDLASPTGETQSDTIVQLGSGRLMEEIEESLVGARAGESTSVEYEVAEGQTASIDVNVKQVHESVLPEIGDELARTGTEFETLAELRADIESRITEALEREIDTAFRGAAVDELVRASDVRGAGPLVESRARELLDGFLRSLARRGIAPEQYFEATGQTPDVLAAQVRAEAAQSVARELALEALAERAGIQISDEDVNDLIREQAELSGDDPDEVIADVWAHGHQETLRDDLRLRAALDRLVADVKRISPETASAREAIWTPDKEKAPSETKLWTPGSEESA